MQPTLYLMMGLPGAGKTTAAKIIERLTGSVRLSSDEARLMLWEAPVFNEAEHQLLYEYLDEQTSRLLKADRSVIYDANLNRYEHRQEKYELARALGATTKLCWVQTPPEIAKNRRIKDDLTHLVPSSDESPAEMFERISKLIETPEKSESFIVLDGTKITSDYVARALDLTNEVN